MNFHTGDVVKYKGKSSLWKRGEVHIINDCSYQGGGDFEYSTNLGAWFSSADFTLVRKADKESFKLLDQYIEADGYEEIE